ncbi:sugar ABC transporter permease [Nocardioides sp. NPDC092400]|uniref:carbohydrate ABC transporter permease n=1 Tax=Nocardioides sp. NPDC092400 TaxID=3155196 RepID=UPI00342DC70B
MSTALSSAPAPPQPGARGRGRRATEAADRHAEMVRTRRLFLAPLTIVLGLLTVVPFVYSVVVSLTDKSGSGDTSFVGLANYVDLLTDPQWWDAARVTAVFTVAVVAIEFLVAMAVAVALHRITRGAPLLRALFLLPMAMAPVAALFNWRLMLNASSGVINYLLGAVGLPQPDWTGESSTALASLVMVDVWQWTPFILVILVGGLSAVPDDVYEAAAVDGASGWQTFRHVTLPMLKPFILVALLFRTIDALKTFDSIQILTGGGPGSSTTTLNFYAFREGISFLNFGRSAAAATLLLLLAIGLSRLLLHWLKEEEAVS